MVELQVHFLVLKTHKMQWSGLQCPTIISNSNKCTKIIYCSLKLKRKLLSSMLRHNMLLYLIKYNNNNYIKPNRINNCKIKHTVFFLVSLAQEDKLPGECLRLT